VAWIVFITVYIPDEEPLSGGMGVLIGADELQTPQGEKDRPMAERRKDGEAVDGEGLPAAVVDCLLADIAVRALSPAVNDPTTAVRALDQIEDVLVRLPHRLLGPTWLLHKAARPCVLCHAPRWPDLVNQ
jgi:hypothetical protein